MIRLDATTRKLQIILGGAVTTNQLPVTVCYSDRSTAGYTGGAQLSNTNSGTAVDILNAPAAGAVRDLDYLSVRNSDTVAATATIRYNDNATLYTIISVTLQPSDCLAYTHSSGWNVTNASGSVKIVPSATTVDVTDDMTTNATMYPVWVTGTTGSLPVKLSSTKLNWNPSTGTYSAPNQSLSGSLAFTGAGNRITGDFSTTTLANRPAFQTSVVNGSTFVGLLPNGTGTSSALVLHDAADPANSSRGILSITTASVTFASDLRGTGTYLPFAIQTGGADTLNLDINGNTYGRSGTTGMTDGFIYIASAAGVPTGVPTAISGHVPQYYDSANNDLYIYNGGWKKVHLA